MQAPHLPPSSSLPPHPPPSSTPFRSKILPPSPPPRYWFRCNYALEIVGIVYLAANILTQYLAEIFDEILHRALTVTFYFTVLTIDPSQVWWYLSSERQGKQKPKKEKEIYSSVNGNGFPPPPVPSSSASLDAQCV